MAIIDHLNCESGTILKIQGDIDVKWEYVNGTSPIKNDINLQSI